MVTCDDFLCMHNGNVHIFHSVYLDYRGAFQLGLDSYCVSRIVDKENSTFQVIVDGRGIFLLFLQFLIRWGEHS